MFAVYVYYADSGALSRCIAHVSTISYESGCFRVHVDGTSSDADILIDGRFFVIRCYAC